MSLLRNVTLPRPIRYAVQMQLHVFFFGILRDRFAEQEALEQFPGRTVADLLRYYRAVAPEISTVWNSIAVAVNQQYATLQTPLADGDEVALLPPVSGGAERPSDAD